MSKGTLKLSWEDYPGLSRWAQCHHECPYKRKVGGSNREGGQSEELQKCKKEPQAKECRWPVEAGQGQEGYSLLKCSEWVQPWWRREFSSVETVTDFNFLGSKITVATALQTVTAAMKSQDACFLEKSYDKQWIKKQRHHFANKDLYCQSYGFFQ